MATCDIEQLLADGKCWMCLNKKQADAVLAQMLCNLIASAVIPPSPDECEDLFQDPFNGPENQELLDPPWIQFGDTFLYSAGTAIEDPGGDGSAAWVRQTWMIDGYAQAKCLGTGVHRITLRDDYSIGGHYYAAVLDEATNNISIARGTTTLAGVSATFVAGYVLRLEARGAVLTAKYNGATVLVVHDTSGSAISDEGHAGMRGSEDLGAVFDDYECCSWD